MEKFKNLYILLFTLFTLNVNAQNWNWSGVNCNVINPCPFLRSLKFFDTNNGFAVGHQSHGDGYGGTYYEGLIYRTIDGGGWWSSQYIGGQRFNSFCFVNTNLGYIVGTAGTILRTKDGWATWAYQTSGTTNNLVFVFFTDANIGYIVGENGTILKTINGGSIWTKQTWGVNNLNSVFFTDANCSQ